MSTQTERSISHIKLWVLRLAPVLLVLISYLEGKFSLFGITILGSFYSFMAGVLIIFISSLVYFEIWRHRGTEIYPPRISLCIIFSTAMLMLVGIVRVITEGF